MPGACTVIKKMLCGCGRGVHDLKRGGLGEQFPSKEPNTKSISAMRNMLEMQSPGRVRLTESASGGQISSLFVSIFSFPHQVVLKHEEV